MISDADLILEAKDILTRLNDSVSKNGVTTNDEFRFREYLRDILIVVKKENKVNNRLLINLDRFYQSVCTLKGLGTLKFSEQQNIIWREYDKFVYDNVKSQLKVYSYSPVF